MNLEECFSQIDSCEFECEGGPLRLNVGYIQLKSNTAKLEQQLAELKTECDKLVDRDSAIIWLRAERDHRRQERDKAQQQLAELREAFDRLISVAEQCDGWEFFPSEELDAALANNTLFFQAKKNITQRIDRLNT